jgi:dipeptidyl aminopeptidase/acylaminoacyl peptidase
VEVNPAGTQLTATFMAEAENTQTAVHVALAGDSAPVTLDVSNAVGARTFFTPTEGELIVSQDDPKKEKDIVVPGIGSSSLSRWKIADNSRTEPVRAHGNRVNALAFSPDGARFATASQDVTAVVWNSSDLTPVATLRGHSGALAKVTFSPDGNRVVTGGNDRTFKIFDVATGAQILTLNNAAVTANLQVPEPKQVAFSPDGLHLATITEPPVSPMILHAFSTDTAAYPAVEEAAPSAEGAEGTTEAALSETEKAAAHLEKQMEAYKRQYWRK